jgi:hypothetical protein
MLNITMTGALILHRDACSTEPKYSGGHYQQVQTDKSLIGIVMLTGLKLPVESYGLTCYKYLKNNAQK